MKKYAKIINEETKQCDVALGKYIPEGFTEQEVEQDHNGAWYIAGYVPQPSIEEQNEKIRQQRQERYVAESDPLRMDYDEALAREQDNAEQLKQDWLASKDKIREELPYITGGTDE